MQGGSSADAAVSAKQQLASGLIGMAKNFAGGIFGGGILGAIGGSLVGGLLGWGISALFGLNKPRAVEHETPKYQPVINSLDFIKMFTLPESAYFQPSGRNIGPVQMSQNNTINITGGAKEATRLQRALTDPALLDQLQRGFV